MADFSTYTSGPGAGGPREQGRRRDQGGGGGRGGGRGADAGARPDPRDQAQLAAHPVSGRRILALFAPHRWPIATVLVLIVASSALGLASPFLVREIVDVAIPEQDVRLLLLLVGTMVGVAVLGAVLGVLQTWISTTTGQRIMHGLRTQLFTPCSVSRCPSSPAPAPERCSPG